MLLLCFTPTQVLNVISSALLDPCDGVRAAAANCITALTRTVRQLRSNLLDPDVGAPLCKLLSDPNTDVQVRV